jgi:hypothetical protein
MEHLSEASGELRKTQWADMTYAGIQVAIWTTLLKEVMADVSMLSEGAQDRAARALLAFSRLRRLADQESHEHRYLRTLAHICSFPWSKRTPVFD